jgi:hypothetical protein
VVARDAVVAPSGATTIAGTPGPNRTSVVRTIGSRSTAVPPTTVPFVLWRSRSHHWPFSHTTSAWYWLTASSSKTMSLSAARPIRNGWMNWSTRSLPGKRTTIGAAAARTGLVTGAAGWLTERKMRAGRVRYRRGDPRRAPWATSFFLRFTSCPWARA